jgi:hypothetical protein
MPGQVRRCSERSLKGAASHVCGISATVQLDFARFACKRRCIGKVATVSSATSSKHWATTIPSVVTLPFISPSACSLAISPRGNPRLYAQPGQFIVTNLGDLEDLLVRVETVIGQRVVIAADMPIECAEEALEDLAYMGLSPATMFPGLDGVCRKMRHEMRQPMAAPRRPSALLHLESFHGLESHILERVEIVLHLVLRDIDLEPHRVDCRGRSTVHGGTCAHFDGHGTAR